MLRLRGPGPAFLSGHGLKSSASIPCRALSAVTLRCHSALRPSLQPLPPCFPVLAVPMCLWAAVYVPVSVSPDEPGPSPRWGLGLVTCFPNVSFCPAHQRGWCLGDGWVGTKVILASNISSCPPSCALGDIKASRVPGRLLGRGSAPASLDPTEAASTMKS